MANDIAVAMRAIQLAVKSRCLFMTVSSPAAEAAAPHISLYGSPNLAMKPRRAEAGAWTIGQADNLHKT
jgi:hypothetical protein